MIALHATFLPPIHVETEPTMRSDTQTASEKPYATLGAGQLTSTLWKNGDVRSGWSYRFNIYRTNSRNGRVFRLFRPVDVPHLIKLCYVLAAALVDDGCISADERRILAALATKLDRIIRKDKSHAKKAPPRNPTRPDKGPNLQETHAIRPPIQCRRRTTVPKR